MNQWWQMWPGYFREAECRKVLELAERFRDVDATVGGLSGKQHAHVDKRIRRSRIRWIPRFDPQFFHLFGTLELLFNEANSNAFGFNLTMFHAIQLTKYDSEDQGAYDWHHDTVWVSDKLHRRKLSLVLQLSDPRDYSGGRLELDSKECKVAPDEVDLRQQGTVIVFPSFLKHRVTPVTSGTRYSLVTWMEGPAFR